MLTCKKCGDRLLDTDNYCPNCGRMAKKQNPGLRMILCFSAGLLLFVLAMDCYGINPFAHPGAPFAGALLIGSWIMFVLSNA